MKQNQKKYLPLKYFMLFLIICANSFSSHAQLLKRIRDDLKTKAEIQATDKISDNINRGIDSLTKPNSKKKNTGKNSPAAIPNNPDKPINTDSSTSSNSDANSNSANTDSTNTYNTSTDNNGAENANSNVPTTQDGYISLITSANTAFPGASIIIRGESVMYGKFKSIGLTIQGPYTEDPDPKPVGGFAKLVKQISLDKDGKFTTTWNVGGNDGQFIITATSSDGKATKIKTVIVNAWPDMSDMADSNITVTNKVYEKLVKRIEEVIPNISKPNGIKLKKYRDDIKDKKDAAIKFYTSLNAAAKKLGMMVAKGKGLPPGLNENITELNNTLSAQASDMARMDGFTNHEPADNSICEYLEMVKEACTAFTTINSVYATTLTKVVKNITLENVVPMGIGMGNEAMGSPVDPDITLKEPGKLFGTVLEDAEELETKLGSAGVAGGLIEFGSDILMKTYCGEYEGILKHDYKVIFRNSQHIIWWKYAVEMEATINLRYPKDKNTGRIIKMKGNIEGNATKFKFFADAKEAVKDEMKGSDKFVEVIVLQDIPPVALPFSTSVHDKLGFGAIARSIGTPAYFNIPIDAEYDLDAEKIKLFINSALLDFSPEVTNKELFVVLAVLPIVKWQSYPIFKAQETIKGSFKEKNEFPMEGGTHPKCDDKVTRHINDENAPFEIFLNTSFEIKKE
jgi:hypothetical protein